MERRPSAGGTEVGQRLLEVGEIPTDVVDRPDDVGEVIDVEVLAVLQVPSDATDRGLGVVDEAIGGTADGQSGGPGIVVAVVSVLAFAVAGHDGAVRVDALDDLDVTADGVEDLAVEAHYVSDEGAGPSGPRTGRNRGADEGCRERVTPPRWPVWVRLGRPFASRSCP
jgi:hypothetical protein